MGMVLSRNSDLRQHLCQVEVLVLTFSLLGHHCLRLLYCSNAQAVKEYMSHRLLWLLLILFARLYILNSRLPASLNNLV